MKESPEIIKGTCYSDVRGSLYYNNDFDTTEVKRIYFIENKDIAFKRGWQGHKIEQRWFAAVQGSFKISVIAIDNWENPSDNLIGEDFVLDALAMDVLHVPKGYVTCIKALQDISKLMALSDYFLGEVTDEYRFDSNYFK
jgi:hypothetical protein